MRGRSAARWLLWAVPQIYDREILLKLGLSWVTRDLRCSWGLAPPPLGHPPLSDDAVLPVPGADLNAGNTSLSLAPPPPWGQGWRKGALRYLSIVQPDPVLTWTAIVPNFFRQFLFSSGKIRAFELSSGIFFYFSDFNQNFFAISNFRGKNFPAKRISRPEKVRVSGYHDLRSGERFTTMMPVSCRTDNFFSNFRARFFFFFQLSTGKFSGFLNFEPKKNRLTKFQSQIFCPEKISDCAGRR